MRHFQEQFQNLALDFVCDQFSLSPDFVSTSPGGSDTTRFEFDSQKLSAGNLRKLTLLQAHLQQARSIQLHRLASTLVIAFNESRQSLVIVSNQGFSTEAIRHAVLFRWKAQIQVRLIDGLTLSHWVKINIERLMKHYAESLLDSLISPFEGGNKPELREIRVDSSSLRTMYGAIGLFTTVKSATIQLGWKDSSTIAPCEIVYDDIPDTSSLQKEAVIGRRHNFLIERLTEVLQNASQIAVISGEAGIGKTMITMHTLNNLATRLVPGTSIDLKTNITTRQLFWAILTAFSGVDHRLSVAGSTNSIASLLQFLLGKQLLPEELSYQIAQVVADKDSTFAEHREINEELLVNYLEVVAKKAMERCHSVLAFEALNASTAEALKFLLVLVRRLAAIGFSILIELRSFGDCPYMEEDEWQRISHTFERVAHAGVFKVERLTEAEAFEFLDQELPGLGKNRCSVIVRRVGCVPLFLLTTANWLRDRKIVSRRVEKYATIEEIEKFFTGIRPENCSTLLVRVVNYWRQKLDLRYSYLFCGSSLFGGTLPLKAISRIQPEISPDSVVEALERTGLFYATVDPEPAVIAAHELISDTIDELSNPIALARVADLLYPDLKNIICDETTLLMKRVDFLVALGKWEEVRSEAYRAGNALKEEKQWAQSSRYYRTGVSASLKVGKASSQFFCKNVESLLTVENERYRLGREENLTALDALNAALWTLKRERDSSQELARLQFRALWFAWRAFFTKEKFDAALAASRDCKVWAAENQHLLGEETCGEAYSAHALSLKVLGRTSECFEQFDEAVREFPSSISAQVQRLSNLAAHKLNSEPEKSLGLYLEILQKTAGQDFSPLAVLHARVDVAMAHFLLKHYEEAISASIDALSLVEMNAIPAQEARAKNILGCCYWAKKATEKADDLFDQAVFLAEVSLSRRFLWRMRTNRVGTAFELGDTAAAHGNALSALQLLMTTPTALWRGDSKIRGSQSRRYVALLSLLKHLTLLGDRRAVNETLEALEIPPLASHLRLLCLDVFPEEVFDGTTILHDGKIMITG